MFKKKINSEKLKLGKNENTKIGVAFGGGGARGFSHLGVIKAFEEYGLEFDYIAGTSAGSIVGAFYAAGWTFQEMYDLSSKFKMKDIKTSRVPLMPSKTDSLEKILKDNLGDIDITELRTPFSAVAVDLTTTMECIITKGNLSKAVAASCCIPGVFHPVSFGDYILVDGGLQNTLPASVPKVMGCDYVIGIDVNASRAYGTTSSKFLDVIACSIRILMKGNVTKGYLFADVVIIPETKRFKSTKVNDVDEMVEEGYRATIEKMPEILSIFNMKPVKQKVKNKYQDEAIVL